MRTEWNMVTCGDVVLNHVATDSPFLQEHPECGYNLENTPHMRPAYALDRALVYFGVEVAEGKLEKSHQLPAAINSEEHMEVGDIE